MQLASTAIPMLAHLGRAELFYQRRTITDVLNDNSRKCYVCLLLKLVVLCFWTAVMMGDPTSLKVFRESWKREIEKKVELHNQVSESKDSTVKIPVPGSGCSALCKNSSERGISSLHCVGSCNERSELRGLRRSLGLRDSRNNPLANSSKREEDFSLLNRLINSDDGTKSEGRTSCTLRPFQIAGDLLRGKTWGDTSIDSHLSSSKRRKCETNEENSKLETGTDKTKERFLDRLLADLDEINEIPFFDLNLSREVALNIFQHLSLTDLCRCAQVSRSWKSIAEDEHLWCKICHRYGYETSSKTIDRKCWKQIAKECVLYELHLKENWRQRLGHCYAVDYIHGGVLCSANTYHTSIVAGYTSGNVKFQDLSTENTYVFKPSNTSLVLNESEDMGTITNYITSVAVNDTITVAGFNQGYVDIWRNSSDSHPVHSVHCNAPVRAVSLAQDSALAAVTYGTFLRLEQGDSSGQFHCLEQLDAGEVVSGLQIVKNHQTSSPADQYMVVMTTKESVKIHIPGHGAPSCIHSIFGAPVTCLDAMSTTVACGVTTALDYTTAGISLYRGKIYLYSLMTGKEMYVLEGECNAVSCIDMSQFDIGLLCTGSDDRRVRVYDSRAGARHPVHSFSGHGAAVTVVHMDDWKVVSGGAEGLVCIWDQRMGSKLWEVHNRHPVRHCAFTDKHLVSAHVPNNKFPENYELDNILHKRYRGTVQVYDFSVDQSPEGVPDVCLSTYDEPDRAKGTVGLMVPYDKL
ncbi:F-box/WD repeat-containing protein 8 [Lingula anatina]|uniref:F-box/WD repeat-containing protein 8 n=1 Tax=Lingula anatina TaxID=7574 RepID=A0A1S3JU13_LINAN|nr:F-box/WD repeat-containing protein 8 [Lingula anatina]|eukprot:XP_013413586.1 F-box/WD repeat-containing protein 8 [Lingula anatina]